MKNAVEKAIKDVLSALGIEPPASLDVGLPKEEAHGDLSSTVSFALSKTLRRPPRKLAEEIAGNIPPSEVFEKVEVAGGGFINFTFKKEYLYSSLRALLEGGRAFLREDIGKGRRIQVEFVSANPTGPLHLGHGRGAAFGAALANLLEAGGYRVVREFYINDAGRQVALLGRSVFARYKELLGVPCPMPEDGYRGDYVIEIANALKEKFADKYKEATFEEAGDAFVGFSLDAMLRLIREDLGDFGVRFDSWQSERELYESGAVGRAIEHLKGKGFAYESEGALWFGSKAFGDEKDRVVVKKDGQYTYFAPDIAYHLKKIEGGFNELIDVWGADHHGYIPRMKAVIEALGYDREKLRVVLVQMVSLQRGGRPVAMSKRAGEFVTLREVMDEVGADTTKFIFLTRRPDSHLSFDLETAKAQSAENPVYYVQYANARINSIFAHAKEMGIKTAPEGGANLALLEAEEELRLIKKLLSYPMVFEGAVAAHEPHRITFYLQELAGLFHPYYNRHRVVVEDGALTLARLALLGGIRAVLRDGLEILGLSAPERM